MTVYAAADLCQEYDPEEYKCPHSPRSYDGDFYFVCTRTVECYRCEDECECYEKKSP